DDPVIDLVIVADVTADESALGSGLSASKARSFCLIIRRKVEAKSLEAAVHPKINTAPVIGSGGSDGGRHGNRVFPADDRVSSKGRPAEHGDKRKGYNKSHWLPLIKDVYGVRL